MLWPLYVIYHIAMYCTLLSRSPIAQSHTKKKRENCVPEMIHVHAFMSNETEKQFFKTMKVKDNQCMIYFLSFVVKTYGDGKPFDCRNKCFSSTEYFPTCCISKCITCCFGETTSEQMEAFYETFQLEKYLKSNTFKTNQNHFPNITFSSYTTKHILLCRGD